MLFESENKAEVYMKDIIAAELVDKTTAESFEKGTMTKEEVKRIVAELRVFVDGTMPIAGIINAMTGTFDFYKHNSLTFV